MDIGFQVTNKDQEDLKKYLTTENKTNHTEQFNPIQKAKLILVARDLFQNSEVPINNKALILKNLDSALEIDSTTDRVFAATISTKTKDISAVESTPAVNNPYTIRDQLAIQLLQESILQEIPPILDINYEEDFDRWLTEVKALLDKKSEAVQTFDDQIKHIQSMERDVNTDTKLEILEETRAETMNIFQGSEEKLLEGISTPMDTANMEDLRKQDSDFARKVEEKIKSKQI